MRKAVVAAVSLITSLFLAAGAGGVDSTGTRATARLDCGITAPPQRGGKPIFPQRKTVHARFLVLGVEWRGISPQAPVDATDPADEPYEWASTDVIFAQAAAAGIEIVPLVYSTPPWANGARGPEVGPNNPQTYADFLTAMSTRYPQVRRWMIWGEPSRLGQWSPQGVAGARAYAALLDRAYAALKKVDPADLVIGGNTQPSGLDDRGATSPATWIRRLVLPNGRRPRFDLWGHNPFTERPINLRLRPTSRYIYDFNDVDTLAANLDRYFPGRRIRLFLSETGSPTEHASRDWLFKTTRADQAARLSKMLKVARSYRRIAAISNYLLFDEASQYGWTTGLVTAKGVRKPAWFVYRKLCSA